MVVALNAECHKALSQLVAERCVEIQYQAAVLGKLENDSEAIDLPLGGDWPNRPKQKADVDSCKHTRTD